jgi:hypothetical protein
MITQFALLNRDPQLRDLFEFIKQHDLAHEVHANRTRFWISDGPVLTEFLLRFEHYHIVQANEDLATGQVLDH